MQESLNAIFAPVLGDIYAQLRAEGFKPKSPKVILNLSLQGVRVEGHRAVIPANVMARLKRHSPQLFQ